MTLTLNSTRRGALGWLAGGAALALMPRAAAALTPDAAAAAIRQAIAEVYAVIDAGLPEGEMYARFTRVFASRGDVNAIARTCLGPAARGLPEAAFAAYRDAFTDYIGRRYGRRFHEFVGGRVEVTAARPEKSFVVVSSTAYLNGQAPIAVDWHVSDKSGAPRFFNLIIEGVNMLGTERQEIGAMLARRNGDLNALIADLRALA